ncbi:RTA1-like protein [Mycena floridula]|nr:RTA1-like protein [Mycena floridula]
MNSTVYAVTELVPHVLSNSGRDGAVNYPYNYIPSRAAGFLFLILFGVSTLSHAVQGLYFRTWWVFPTIVLAGIIECVGWTGRLMSSYSPTAKGPFLAQITTTIIAPTPLVAGNFIILGALIARLGPVYSRLSPKWYSIIFCSFDFISLLVQGAGGGLASTQDDPTLGGHIMLGGIIFQLVTMSIYVCLASEFLYRYLKDRPLASRRRQIPDSLRGAFEWKLKAMVAALIFSTIVLFYRVVELGDGWDGRIISTEIYFIVLDGGMVTLAMYVLNVVHPGWFLAEEKDPQGNPIALKQHRLQSSSSSLV